MPRFYLHLRNDGGYSYDREGSELLDLPAVVAEAVGSAREHMAADLGSFGSICLSDAIEVDDENGEPVLVLPFRNIVTISA